MKRRLTYATLVAYLGLVPLACSHDSQSVDEAIEADQAGIGLENAASVADEDASLSAEDGTSPDIFAKADEAAATPLEAEPIEGTDAQAEATDDDSVAPATNLAATEDGLGETMAEAVAPHDEIEANPDFTLTDQATNTEPRRKSIVGNDRPVFEPVKTEVAAVEPVKKSVKKRSANKREKQRNKTVAARETKSVEPATTDAVAMEAATANMPVPTDGKFSVYVVGPGDSLSKIARRLYGDKNEWRMLAQVNDIDNPSRILPGQVIRFPADERTANFRNNLDRAKERVVVQAGDTLGGLARKLMGSTSYWKALWQMNADKVSNPNMIRTNQVLYYFDMSKVEATTGTANAY